MTDGPQPGGSPADGDASVAEDCVAQPAPAGTAERGAAQRGAAQRGAALAVTGVAAFAAVVFVVSWAVMHSPLLDALGETFGTVALVLLLVSILGALGQSR